MCVCVTVNGTNLRNLVCCVCVCVMLWYVGVEGNVMKRVNGVDGGRHKKGTDGDVCVCVCENVHAERATCVR